MDNIYPELRVAVSEKDASRLGTFCDWLPQFQNKLEWSS